MRTNFLLKLIIVGYNFSVNILYKKYFSFDSFTSITIRKWLDNEKCFLDFEGQLRA